ncbi:MAG: Na+-dependent transporter [Candidatus Methanomethylophilus sp.]|nr:Na+-dependent transporter [Methanomethylophilus sp.]MDD3233070.1 Na+-dependent transporter [Methanomethylophilus sp.]MDD4222273.1 Na+-dependent transporter [Methanomethylophilus sp.]MDD4668442.1 Na+-dependent transporter [Methanomethylophilus sp.]
MPLKNVLMDLRIWVLAAVVVAFAVGSLGSVVSTLVIVVLMLQMIAAMEGLSFHRADFAKDKKPIFWSFFACFGICTGLTLAVGLLFMGPYPDVWKGWVMLAAVPSAVSVLTVALFMRGDMVMAVLSMTVIYLISLGLTPLLTTMLIGDAISPLEIFKYVLLFIAVPLLANIPLKRFKINRDAKVVFINFMMFMLIVLSVGKNRDYMLGDPLLVGLIVVACLFRTFAVSLIMLRVMKRHGAKRDNAVVYMGFAVWKNSGLATTMCLVLLADSPGAVLPCVISLLIESVWFAIMSGHLQKVWPPTETLQQEIDALPEVPADTLNKD